MPRKKEAQSPTDEEILGYANVPPALAASYIGWSSPTVYRALQDERAPFGFAVQNQDTGSWAYNISPGLLVRYKRGELPTYRLNEVIALAAEGVERVVDAKLESINQVLKAVMG